MWLVYRASDGRTIQQPWQDIQDVGTLIDPDSGEDRAMLGWTATAPQQCSGCDTEVSLDPESGSYAHLDEAGNPDRWIDRGHYAEPRT